MISVEGGRFGENAQTATYNDNDCEQVSSQQVGKIHDAIPGSGTQLASSTKSTTRRRGRPPKSSNPGGNNNSPSGPTAKSPKAQSKHSRCKVVRLLLPPPVEGNRDPPSPLDIMDDMPIHEDYTKKPRYNTRTRRRTRKDVTKKEANVPTVKIENIETVAPTGYTNADLGRDDEDFSADSCVDANSDQGQFCVSDDNVGENMDKANRHPNTARMHTKVDNFHDDGRKLTARKKQHYKKCVLNLIICCTICRSFLFLL